MSSQVIATEPLGSLARELIPENHCVEDANYILDYFRRTADGRILFGGGAVYDRARSLGVLGREIMFATSKVQF